MIQIDAMASEEHPNIPEGLFLAIDVVGGGIVPTGSSGDTEFAVRNDFVIISFLLWGNTKPEKQSLELCIYLLFHNWGAEFHHEMFLSWTLSSTSGSCLKIALLKKKKRENNKKMPWIVFIWCLPSSNISQCFEKLFKKLKLIQINP